MAIKEGEFVTPEEAMEEALRVAGMGRGYVSPNPLVGCTLVDKHHRFLAAGGHLRFGKEHAEINALKKVLDGDQLAGGTMYVTLEPCSHHGKTPPCTSAIVQTKLKKVVYGSLDPNPEVSGRGCQLLQAAGIEVGHFTTMEKKCQRLMEQYLHWRKSHKPFVALKIAASLDGKIALISGESQWLTGAATRHHARSLRAHYDATFIGAGTFLNDDPRLDFRDTPFDGHKKNRVVLLDPRAKACEFFKKSRIHLIHGPERVIVLTNEKGVQAWQDQGVQTIPWQAHAAGWEGALSRLRDEFGICSLFVEGGAFAISQLLQFKLMEKVYLYQAPKIIGAGKSWSETLKIANLNAALPLKEWLPETIGEDLLVTGWF